MRKVTAIAMAAAGTALLLAASGNTHGTREGGTFRVAVAIGRIATIDPALWSFGFPPEAILLSPVCATLMAYPDKPLPAGGRLTPSLAEAAPVVSRDGKTYTFTIRKDARFSTGAPVTAQAFVRAYERLLDPTMKTDAADLAALIVGGEDVLAGKAKTPSGLTARGRTLTVRLTRKLQPSELFGSGVCAVPPNLPADPEGARAPLPSPAPYYIAEYVPGERLVMQRNPYYKGERPHHVARFVADLASDFGPGIDEVASGTVDTFIPGPTVDQTADLARRYGVNKSQFFVKPTTTVRGFFLNTSRPLFRNNVKLRQAVNFAVNRKALVQTLGPFGGTATDQNLPPGIPGFRDERIYPLIGPDLRSARALAKGHLRGGKAVLYTIDNQVDASQAQILKQNLAKIGLDVEVNALPFSAYFEKLFTPGEPWDIGRLGIGLSSAADLSGLFDNFGLPPKYDRLLERASHLTGAAREDAYGELDVEISRDVAPAIPVAVSNWPTFVSARVGCVVVNPYLDLAAACLK